MVSPNGLRLYLLNQGTQVVAWYNIAADGSLSALVGSIATGAGPLAMVMSPDGTSLYVSNFTAGTISQYDVAAGGGLTAKSPASVAAAREGGGHRDQPRRQEPLRHDPGEPRLHLRLRHDPSNGKLTPKSTPSYSAMGNNPRGLAVSPDGKSLYVAVNGDAVIRMFDIDAAGT